jgi:hypothetical protein
MLTTGQVYLADDRLPQLELGHLKAARHRQVTQVAQPRHQLVGNISGATKAENFKVTGTRYLGTKPSVAEPQLNCPQSRILTSL